MAKRSILSGVRGDVTPQSEAPSVSPAPAAVSSATGSATRGSAKPSRHAKLHVGGYFDPDDPSVMAFQKLKVDLRRSQQDMLHEALEDFVAKHQAHNAFKDA